MTEEEMIAGSLKKDEKAQKALYTSLSGKMMGVALRYCNSQQEAEDVLQDGFIKVFGKLKSYNGEGVFEGWVRRIIVNTALDYIRKSKNERFHMDVNEVDYLLADQTIILEALAAEDLLKVIQELPAGYRTVFNLFAIEGYSHKEIAEELGVTVNTSKSQYSRARIFLQKKLEDINITSSE